MTFKLHSSIVAYSKVVYATICYTTKIVKGEIMAEFDDCIGFELKMTKNVMENEHNKYLKDFGISNEQGLLLALVYYDMPGCTQTQLAEALMKDKTTITRMVDTLVKKGKLERRASQEDRRVFNIYVTEDVGKSIEELNPIFEKREQELRELIGEEDYKRTIKVLRKMREYYKGLNK